MNYSVENDNGTGNGNEILFFDVDLGQNVYSLPSSPLPLPFNNNNNRQGFFGSNSSINLIIFLLFMHNCFRDNLFYILMLRYLRRNAPRAAMYMINDVIYPVFFGIGPINEVDGDEEDEDEEDKNDFHANITDIAVKIAEKYEDKYMDKFKNAESVELSKEKLDSLKNSILFENTPNGNVVMFYDNSRESFAYYSDNTIPYRFLEVIARKYVIVNNCKSIYVDMAYELQEAERKINEKKQKKEDEKQQQQQKQKDDSSTVEQQQQQPKDVFAKFKNYNKDSSIQSASIPLDAKSHTQKHVQPDVEKIVKDNANRYSCEGKMANFNFLKKVDRKVVDKRYGTSFADFKKAQIKTESSSKCNLG